MNSLSDYLAYCVARFLGFIVCRLPIRVAVGLGRIIGVLGYHFDVKHRSLAYANLKVAFGKEKKPREIKKITKKLFENFGRNFIELYYLPLIHRLGPEKFVSVTGKEHVFESLKKGKGAILLAMHFGSWEISSFMSTILDRPYKVMVKKQKKFSRLDMLLNSYRQCGGSVAIMRGRGTRDLIEGLQKNEVVGMVVDQGGRNGSLVKFFGRNASMSVGAIRMGLRLGIPICFSIIIRDCGSNHRLIIHQPFDLIDTGNVEEDIKTNLSLVVKRMEHYIKQYPAEYMWFYKIWKYSNEMKIVIINDGKTGHLRQSETVAKWIQVALSERNISSEVNIVNITFKNKIANVIVRFSSALLPSRFFQGRLRFLKYFLMRESYRELTSVHGDFTVSCGTSSAGLNIMLSRENRAKSITILRPGFLHRPRFNLVVLPQHDVRLPCRNKRQVAVVKAAPNLITKEYLEDQKQQLLKRYSHIKDARKRIIGVLLGGDTRSGVLTENQIKVLFGNVKEAAEKIDADILITTSRRTSSQVENAVNRILKPFSRCRLIIIANRNNIPEAVGGILGLSDIVITSGDSISMISEAASSGKNTIVFPIRRKKKLSLSRDKHARFIMKLHEQGYIFSCSENNIGNVICDMAKNKIRTKHLDDNVTILEAARKVI